MHKLDSFDSSFHRNPDDKTSISTNSNSHPEARSPPTLIFQYLEKTIHHEVYLKVVSFENLENEVELNLQILYASSHENISKAMS
jgi:hypothetical protein